MKNAHLALSIALASFVCAAMAGPAQAYQFPFKGEDMNPGERIYTEDHAAGIQGEGEDLGAMRYLGGNKWSWFKEGASGTGNSDHVVYGKPVHAIADGTIVGCWRNAPENPRPRALHDEFITGTKTVNGEDVNVGLIPGGGNMLFVDLPDKNRVLYAHMIPGSIPASLCPNNDTYLPKAMTISEGDAYLMLDARDQVKIKKGQFLGKVGNAGNSGGPHLHIHAQKGGNAAIMRFEQGLFKPYTEGNTDIKNGWASFGGQEVPDGRVLIRPSRSTTYRMVDFESYQVNGKQMYAGIFKPGAYSPTALFENDWNRFLAGWKAIEAKGYRMKDLEVYQRGDTRMYAGIFEPGTYGPMALFKGKWNEFLDGWKAIEANGYRIKDLEVYQNGGDRVYAGIFEPGTHGPTALFKNEWGEFLAGWKAIEARGYRMKDLEVFQDGSRQVYAGIFEPGNHAPMALFHGDWNGFVNGWRAIEARGYRMKDIEVFRESGRLRYAGIFEPGTYNPAALFISKDWDAFTEGWQQLE